MSNEKFNWEPEEYLTASHEQQKWAAELARKLDFRGSEHLLDIGCGDGRATAEISRSLPEGFALGTDSSEKMIAFGKERFENKEFPNLKFQVADARALPFKNDFDIVFSNAALHWVRDHAPVLAGIGKALRPGGKALLQMGGQGNAATVLEVMDIMMKSENWRGFFQDFDFHSVFTARKNIAD